MRARVFSLVLFFCMCGAAISDTNASTLQKQMYRIEQATPEILQAVASSGVDVVTVRGLGAAQNWRPRGMAEIDLALTPLQLAQLQALGLNLRPIADEAHEQWQRVQDAPQRDRNYHNYTALTALLQSWVATYPSICRMYSAGLSVQGRELWVLKITDNPDENEDEPEIKYVATMHGNEALGTEMLLSLAEDLLMDYGTDTRLTTLVNGMEIHLLFMMNPDGNTAGTRTNAHGVDLNRNFPDPFTSPNNTGVGREAETAAVIAWTQGKDFDLSINFHTGALLVNYPFDNNASGSSVYTPCPDDDLFIQMALSYSTPNSPMYNGAFPQGISNGADWYAVSGGMQDWNYRYEGGMEVVVELSDTYMPDVIQLPTYYNNNRESMLAYMEWAFRGVRGVVTSAATGLPLPGVEVRVTGRDYATWSAAGVGDYHRILLPGTYSLTFSKAGYVSQTITGVTVASGAATVHNVALQPVVAAPDLSLGAVTVVDGGNGRLDPGETATVQIQVSNVGTTNATALNGVLSSSSAYITVNSGSQAYGTVAPGGSATASYSVSASASTPAGETVAFNLAASCTELTEQLPFALSVGLVTEDFESGSLSAWPWIQGGNANWTASTTLPYAGTYCGRSGVITDSQTSAMSLTLNFASAGTVSFAVKASTESNYDFLRFSVDGVVQASWSGNQAWTVVSFPVSAGVHVLRWSYEKDSSLSTGDDAGYIDNILFPPVAAMPQADWVVTPSAISASLLPGGSVNQSITLQNAGSADLTWTGQVHLDGLVAQSFGDLKLPKGVEDRRSVPALRNAGGPDTYGYTWADSRQPSGGPVYSWVEISGLGTALTAGDDQNYGPFNLGFSMPWYGNSYSTVRICSNGFLSFTATETAYSNTGIPNSGVPNNLIAPYWDDLDPTRGGTIYWWDDPAADRFIVEFNAVRHYSGTATETFQVILTGDGAVVFQYRTINTTASTSCTVGIENATGTDGLQCVMNATGFLVNNLAVQFTPPVLTTPWAVLSPLAGTVAAGGSASLNVALSAVDLVDGVYTGTLALASNDPDTPTRNLPLTLTVSSTVDPVTDLLLVATSGTVSLSWSAVPGATGYKVYQQPVAGGAWTLVGTTATPGWSTGHTSDDGEIYRVTATR